MTRSLHLAYLAGGVAAGIALVVACSDDSPGPVDADAAVCDCPVAEPPLAGRITHVRADNNLSPGGAGLSGAFCPNPTTDIVLGGACEVATTDTNIVLLSSRFVTGGYRCDWSTLNATVARTGTAEVVCLTPAP